MTANANPAGTFREVTSVDDINFPGQQQTTAAVRGPGTARDARAGQAALPGDRTYKAGVGDGPRRIRARPRGNHGHLGFVAVQRAVSRLSAAACMVTPAKAHRRGAPGLHGGRRPAHHNRQGEGRRERAEDLARQRCTPGAVCPRSRRCRAGTRHRIRHAASDGRRETPVTASARRPENLRRNATRATRSLPNAPIALLVIPAGTNAARGRGPGGPTAQSTQEDRKWTTAPRVVGTSTVP